MSLFFSKIFIPLLILLTFQIALAGPFVASGKLGYGSTTFGDGDTIPQRSLSAIPVSAFGGVRWGSMQFGLNVGYVHQSQTTEPETVGDQNASGSLVTAGAEAQWVGEKWGVSLEYKALSNYTFTQGDSSGASIRYSGSGYSITIMRSLRRSLGLYIDGSLDTFNKTNDQLLEPNVRNVRYGLGVIVSNFWK